MSSTPVCAASSTLASLKPSRAARRRTWAVDSSPRCRRRGRPRRAKRGAGLDQQRRLADCPARRRSARLNPPRKPPPVTRFRVREAGHDARLRRGVAGQASSARRGRRCGLREAAMPAATAPRRSCSTRRTTRTCLPALRDRAAVSGRRTEFWIWPLRGRCRIRGKCRGVGITRPARCATTRIASSKNFQPPRRARAATSRNPPASRAHASQASRRARKNMETFDEKINPCLFLSPAPPCWSPLPPPMRATPARSGGAPGAGASSSSHPAGSSGGGGSIHVEDMVAPSDAIPRASAMPACIVATRIAVSRRSTAISSARTAT